MSAQANFVRVQTEDPDASTTGPMCAAQPYTRPCANVSA